MIRGLYTAASGMNAQQVNIDVISNNIANVNTTGFKKDRAEFQDLMYESLNYSGGTGDTVHPTGHDVGLGTKVSSIQKDCLQGNLKNTGNDLDVAIQGRGYFAVQTPGGDTIYTRDGSFKIDGTTNTLVNASGNTLQGPVTIPHGTTDIAIKADGTVEGITPGNSSPTGLGQVNVFDFTNCGGLKPLGNNSFAETTSSGTATQVNETELNLAQGFLENSNVSLVNEMVNLITAQRAYEANSKSIQTTDSMLGIVNQLKRS
jgi:flagellar basal-body rod protein FlgG